MRCSGLAISAETLKRVTKIWLRELRLGHVVKCPTKTLTLAMCVARFLRSARFFLPRLPHPQSVGPLARAFYVPHLPVRAVTHPRPPAFPLPAPCADLPGLGAACTTLPMPSRRVDLLAGTNHHLPSWADRHTVRMVSIFAGGACYFRFGRPRDHDKT
jgi:hypothetical protein